MKSLSEQSEASVTELTSPTTDSPIKLLGKISLRKRLLLFLVPPLILLLTISAAIDYKLAHQTIDSAYDSTLADVVTDLESLVRFSGNQPHKLDISPEVENLIESDLPDTIFFCVRDTNGNVLAGDPNVPSFAYPSRAIRFQDGTWQNLAVRIASHTTKISNREIQVTVLKTTLSRSEALRTFLSAMIGPNLIFIALTLLCVWIAVKNGLAPLHHLESEIAKRKVNDLSEIQFSGTYPPETKPLLDNLNELLKVLKKSQISQQQFLADAAHQLRTPLSSVQTNIEIFIKENSQSPDLEPLNKALQSTERMGHLVSQLLAYARSDYSRSLIYEKQKVAFCSLLEKAASTVLDSAIEKNIDLSFDLHPAHAMCVEWMLFEATINLIDNAIRYTPSGGSIEVRCFTDDGRPSLEVIDSGPGIPEENQIQVFDRFYRLPGETGNGCGLGLAIVQQICQLHAATITLSNQKNGGLVARITFPVQQK